MEKALSLLAEKEKGNRKSSSFMKNWSIVANV